MENASFSRIFKDALKMLYACCIGVYKMKLGNSRITNETFLVMYVTIKEARF